MCRTPLFAFIGVLALVFGVLGALAPTSAVRAAAAVTPAAAVAGSSDAASVFPDVESAVSAARAGASDPSSGHQVFVSGQISIDAFYCSASDPTQTFTVPDKVHKLYLEAVGGQGQTPDPSNTGLGGLGGQVTGGLSVTAGQELTVQVGCHGTSEGGASAYAAGGARGVGWTNLNPELTIYSYGYDGGGGGGATAVLGNTGPIAIAGGGGGAAGSAPDCYNARIGQAWFFYCGGNAQQQGGNGGDGAGNDTTGTVGENNTAPATADGSTCDGGNAGAKGHDFNQTGGGGAGGGGGGGYGGGCGGVAGQGMNINTPNHYIVSGNAGNGGGGGQSFVDDSVDQSNLARSDSSGDGYVLFLTSADGVSSTTFDYEDGTPKAYCVPDGVNEIFVDALGGAGAGGDDRFKGVAMGGTGGGVQAVVPVKERTQLQVTVGQFGWAHGGRGDGHGGDRGTASSAAADDGAGGGGSSAVEQSGTPCGESPLTDLHYLVVGGGGGGGGGDGAFSGGGGGGDAGIPGNDGRTGGDPNGGGGGCGGAPAGQSCNSGIHGGAGTHSTTGGGGGGGGGGYSGGGSGHGVLDGEDGGGGGGGGGGGASYVTPKSPQAVHTYPGPHGSNGQVQLIVPIPSTRSQIQIVSGNKQSADPGQKFSEPIVLRYVDALSTGKVEGIPIDVSVVPQTDPPATLLGPASSGRNIRLTTDSTGTVTFNAISAENRAPGQFAVTASVADADKELIKSSSISLFSTQFMTNIKLTSSQAESSDGKPVTFTADLSSLRSGSPAVTSGTVQFAIDGTAFGTPISVVNGHAVSPTIDTLAPGPHHVQATYTDVTGGVNGPSFANLAQFVNVAGTSPGQERPPDAAGGSSGPGGSGHTAGGGAGSDLAGTGSNLSELGPTGVVLLALGALLVGAMASRTRRRAGRRHERG
ncbi:MAG: Ig-like domain repeat protein [Microbacteriaceae bacterium]